MSRLANAAAVATTLTLLTAGLRNTGADRRAIEDKEEGEGEEAKIAAGEKGIVVAEEAPSEPAEAIPSCFVYNGRDSESS